MTRSHSTRDLLRRTALQMLHERGYDNVTVVEIARAAGVSHMTFFRHFSSKEAVVVEDLFDPLIAAAVGMQPVALTPLQRAATGLMAALEDDRARGEMLSEEFVQRVSLVASTRSLRGAAWAASQATEDAIAAELEGPGIDPLTARAAAAAVIGAATALLLEWAKRNVDPASDDERDPAQMLRAGLVGLLGAAP